MIIKIFYFFFIYLTLNYGYAEDNYKKFLERYPHLRDLLFEEEHPGYFLGFGFAPLSFVKDKAKVSASLFEIHKINVNYEWEILKINFGSTLGLPSLATAHHLALRTSLKWRWNETISLGPSIGYEFIVFPGVDSRTTKNTYETPVEPFSSGGLTYGFLINQNFKWRNYRIKVGQVVYIQNYSAKENRAGWRYVFEDDEIVDNPELLDPGTVFLFEVSFLY